VNCREVADFLNLYFEDELSVDERSEFDRHLAECPDCRRYLDGYAKTVETIRYTGKTKATSDSVPEDLIQAILSARTSQ
jgi:predicted anti-sigma-YlaC factor YlaD